MEKNILQNALNEFSQGTTDNIDSIMIKDAAGKQYWMKKADLASVLGGLYQNITDFNNATDPGLYRAESSSNAQNRPSDDTFVVEVTNVGDFYIIQKAYGINSNSFYYRTSFAGNFKSWIKL